MRTLSFIIVIISFLIQGTGCAQNNFSSISKKISKCQISNKLRKKNKDYFHKIRLELLNMGKLEAFINSDTIFFMEAYSIETANFYGEIWDRDTNFIYTYNQVNNQKKFSFDSISVYTPYTKKLIQEWDIEAIRYEEKHNGTLTSPLTIFGTRVIKTEKNYKIDCIVFEEFFLFERDK